MAMGEGSGGKKGVERAKQPVQANTRFLSEWFQGVGAKL